MQLRSASYSYAIVASAALLGMLFPAAAPTVLGMPLVLGLVLFGIAHGACDHWVVPAGRPQRQSLGYMIRFLAGYLGLAAVVIVLWRVYPAAMVALFFLLTVWHWGSADAPKPVHGQGPGQWLLHSVLRGGLIFAIPALCWPLETHQIVNGLLEFVGAAPVADSAFTWAATCLGLAVALGHLALGGIFVRQKQWGRLRTEVLELSLLGALFAALPPILSSGVYFVFWHSLRHVLRMNRLMGYDGAPAGWRQLLRETQFFTLRSLPLLLVSLAALGALFWYLAPRLPDGLALLSLGLVVAAVVTLPHALLVTVVMDADKWQLSKPKAGV